MKTWIKNHKIASVLIAITLIAIVVMAFRSSSNSLAGCLKKKGVKFYGSKNCPHCNNQKKMFGTDAYNLPYIECLSSSGEKLCQEAGVKAYPTWIFPDGTKQEGEMSRPALAKKSGCNI